ncbi:uroporphyrinogen decarboxylase [Aggregatilinea lenta]|uniref:uroporphyrinogen decarboxylase n=1 Tax=Aggregatilinea lenta TaxID=913108 RepID=UPI000E5C0E78|nr:uroporphyrinogen decarboxylase [Aggregatilinea lenta]
MDQSDRFLRACRREPVDTTPIWLMRQAGRYMPEYRAVRAQHSMLDAIRTPELACEITMQPVSAFDLDAAIIFADILPILIGMGLDLAFVKGEGPQLGNAIRTPADVDALRTPSAQENLPYTLEAIRLVRRELDGRIPLIGFSGAPFTLASYAIEGGGSKNHVKVKSFMLSEPDAWARLMDKLATVVADYLVAQVEAGAQTVQVFDSWAGVLAPGDYRAHVLPYTQRVIAQVKATGVPVIYFGTDLNGLLETLPETGADVLGVDWRIDLDAAWARLGEDVAVQGNLDPVALFAPWPAVRDRAVDILARANGRPGHVFNLGHGILPETPVDTVRRLVDFVHEWGTGRTGR